MFVRWQIVGAGFLRLKHYESELSKVLQPFTKRLYFELEFLVKQENVSEASNEGLLRMKPVKNMFV